jgi:O-methyltransferase involved in polyketide biosynthesis
VIPDDATPDLAGTLDPAAHLGAAIVRRQAAETTFNRTRSFDDWCTFADARAAEQATALAFGFATREPIDLPLEDDFVVDDEPIWGLW